MSDEKENGAPVANVPAVASPKPLVTIEERGLRFHTIGELFRFADCVVQSGMAPKGMNAQAVVVAIQLGLELGLSPMSSLQNIGVINGRPGIFGDAAKAIVERSGLMEDFDEHPGRWCDKCESEGGADGKCPVCKQDLSKEEFFGFICTSKRFGRKPLVSGFSIKQAKLADLWGKAVWKTYPNRMLRFRARGFNLRDNFPDVLKGLRTFEEVSDMPAGDYEVPKTVQATETRSLTERLQERAAQVVTPAPQREIGDEPDEEAETKAATAGLYS